jgi:uncharacterized repeat protein (TIGR03943 family)
MVVAVNREVQAAIVLVMGVVFARLAFTDAHLAYVKDTLQIPLILTALVLLAIGVLSIVREKEDVFAEDDAGDQDDATGLAPPGQPGPEAFAPDPAAVEEAGLEDGRTAAGIGVLAPSSSDQDPFAGTRGDDRGGDDGGTLVLDPHGHGHDHSTAPKVGMLMLVPILCLLLVAPAPLGSYAAERAGTNRVAEPTLDLGPLPEAGEDGAIPMTLGDTVVRALFDRDGPMTGEAVRLVGFVTPEEELGNYRLSRFSVSCCAADAAVRQVAVTGAPGAPEPDTWVEVVAVFDGEVYDPDGEGGAQGLPIVRILDQQVIDPPVSPYEY